METCAVCLNKVTSKSHLGLNYQVECELCGKYYIEIYSEETIRNRPFHERNQLSAALRFFSDRGDVQTLDRMNYIDLIGKYQNEGLR
jgi:hypothetical protein